MDGHWTGTTQKATAGLLVAPFLFAVVVDMEGGEGVLGKQFASPLLCRGLMMTNRTQGKAKAAKRARSDRRVEKSYRSTKETFPHIDVIPVALIDTETQRQSGWSVVVLSYFLPVRCWKKDVCVDVMQLQKNKLHLRQLHSPLARSPSLSLSFSLYLAPFDPFGNSEGKGRGCDSSQR